MIVRLTDEAKAKLRAEQFGDLPYAGRKVPEFNRDDVREVPESPYRIIYRIQAHQIDVLTVMHYRQLLRHDIA